MAKNSKIEWCDHTFNPWYGCTKVSPACDHCYAEGWAKRSGLVQWGPRADRRRSSDANWKLPIKWNAEAERLGVRHRVFCASLADVFDNAVPAEWLAELFDLIRCTPHLDWLLLTKRIGNWAGRLAAVQDYLGTKMAGSPKPRSVSDEESDAMNWVAAWMRNDGIDPIPENVWIGATICNQAEADRDIPKLLAVPAAKRFLSMEPLLGPVDLTRVVYPAFKQKDENAPYVAYDTLRGHMIGPDDVGLPKLDWVIVGGESGPGARPMHPDWARNLRDQCEAAGVLFLFKQWGEWVPRGPESMGYPLVEGVPRMRLTDTGDNGSDLSTDGDNHVWMQRAGKKVAGRLLDGRRWNEFPLGLGAGVFTDDNRGAATGARTIRIEPYQGTQQS
jgi:protein gp37